MTALADIPPDQIVRYSTETILDWLAARRERHGAELKVACQTLRAQVAQRERALESLLKVVSAGEGTR